ncbi:MAG: hypothetical protein MUE82_06835 [Chloroflexi bacterium]|jgi:hypothetical protein|nr:hypothetical protein [Chloroflexota bacterium]
MDDAPGTRGPHEATSSPPAVVDPGRARAVVADAISGLHPVVAQSHDGLTLILLGRDPRAGRRSDVGAPAAFALPPGAVGVAVGIFERIAWLDAFDDPEGLDDAWPRILAAAMDAWRARVRAIDAGTVPPPDRRAPDEGAAGRLLRRAALALDRASDTRVHARESGPTRAPGDASDPGDVEVRIRGARVEGTARVSRGRATHVALAPRDVADPPDDLVP